MIDLDEEAGPEGSTVRHLLAHASGLPFETGAPTGRPGQRRSYSNLGFEALAEHIGARAEMPFADYLAAGVLQPLGLQAELRGSPAADLHGSLDDLLILARELQRPTLVAPETLAEATTVQFPGLAGVLPDFGRFDPNDWGLGFELRDDKSPHWTGVAQLAAHIRSLRWQRHLPLGRSGSRPRARRPHEPRLRRLGEGSLAASVGCRAALVTHAFPFRTRAWHRYVLRRMRRDRVLRDASVTVSYPCLAPVRPRVRYACSDPVPGEETED